MEFPVKGWLNTTVEYIRDEDTLTFKLYATKIVTIYFRAGTAWITCGDWNTVTTRRRINQILSLIGVPESVFSKNGTAFVGDYVSKWALPANVAIPWDTKHYLLFREPSFKTRAKHIHSQMMDAYQYEATHRI